MIKIEAILQEKRRELTSLIEKTEKGRKGSIKGGLRVVQDKKHYSYYHCLPEKRDEFPHGKYIPRSDIALAGKIAQRDYDRQLLKWARECLVKLEALMAVYQDEMPLELYEKLIPGRKLLVLPYELPVELWVQKWMDEPYQRKGLDQNLVSFLTEKGERVRSKSEKILADFFHQKGIPYKYECPLVLQGYGTVYPDFTILNKRTRQVWYWEHLGMMDHMDYAQKAISKIHTYEQNRILPGKRLVLSFEGNNHLDMDEINLLVQEYLL